MAEEINVRSADRTAAPDYTLEERKYKDVKPDLAAAIISLRPSCSWQLVGEDWEGLVWNDDPALKPTREEVEAEALRLQKQAPWNAVRRVRNAKLKECDWIVIRSMSRNEPVPQEWSDYMQALRDITDLDMEPVLQDGILKNVPWPTKPETQSQPGERTDLSGPQIGG